MTISGCTPPLFPFASCPSSDESFTDNFEPIMALQNIENFNPSDSLTEPFAESKSLSNQSRNHGYFGGFSPYS